MYHVLLIFIVLINVLSGNIGNLEQNAWESWKIQVASKDSIFKRLEGVNGLD